MGFSGGSAGTEAACNAGNQGSIPGLGRFPEAGHGNLLQYSFLEESMDRGARWAPVHGLAKSRTRLSDFTSLPVSGKTRVALWIPQVALVVKNPSTNAGDVRDMGSNPELGRSPGGRHGHPLQYSCQENPMDRGAWWATVHGVAKSWTQLK